MGKSRWTFVASAFTKNKHSYAWYECSCGEFAIVDKDTVRRGMSKSCGCLWREWWDDCKINHPIRRKHGRKHTPEYKAYMSAKERCTNPNKDNYACYGGRGIKFLFKSFEEFFAELGERPSGLSLDRINNNGNYETGNVRWATKFIQVHNRRKHD